MAPTDPDALVLDHRRLARHLAQRYLRTGEQREDLEQVAYLGLVKAARRFDPDRGVAFTTFALPTVLGELRRFSRDTRWAVHVPRPVQEQVQALRRFEDECANRAPSVGEAARALGWTEEEVLEARMAATCLRAQSLNATLVTDDGTVGEAIDDLGEEDRGFVATEHRDELRRALACLTEPERNALTLRGHDYSTPEIATRLGLSPSQASRLATRAARRLRRALDGDRSMCASRETVVSLADADPELFGSAETAPVAKPVRLARGPWRGPREDEGLGLLVLNGAVLRTLSQGGRTHAELNGRGDVIRSAAGDRDASWRVIAPTELATLDRSLCRWPSVVDTLLRRAADRSHALAVQLAITDLRRAEDRVLALFRVLADRWGQPGPSGVRIDVPLTHEMIAMLVGTHRPAVTTAVRRLDAEGQLRRTLDGWRMRDPADVRPIAA